MLNLCVLVSGSGSILEAMIECKLPIKLVVADRSCRGIDIAASKGIHSILLPRTFGKSFDRKQYTLRMVELLERLDIGLVAMAGFMTVFDGIIFQSFANRIINIHPALLPSFKGENAVGDALAFGVKVTGTTIHYATEKLDDGPIIAQEAVPILPGDSKESLHERIKIVERRLYPKVVKELLQTLH